MLMVKCCMWWHAKVVAYGRRKKGWVWYQRPERPPKTTRDNVFLNFFFFALKLVSKILTKWLQTESPDMKLCVTMCWRSLLRNYLSLNFVLLFSRFSRNNIDFNDNKTALAFSRLTLKQTMLKIQKIFLLYWSSYSKENESCWQEKLLRRRIYCQVFLCGAIDQVDQVHSTHVCSFMTISYIQWQQEVERKHDERIL